MLQLTNHPPECPPMVRPGRCEHRGRIRSREIAELLVDLEDGRLYPVLGLRGTSRRCGQLPSRVCNRQQAGIGTPNWRPRRKDGRSLPAQRPSLLMVCGAHHGSQVPVSLPRDRSPQSQRKKALCVTEVWCIHQRIRWLGSEVASDIQECLVDHCCNCPGCSR